VLSPATADLLGEEGVLEPGSGVTWRAFETGEPEIHENVAASDGIINEDTAIRSELSLPLGEFGVLILASTEIGDFEEADVALAKVLAANTEAALDRTERAVLRELLDSYLRRFRGHDRRTLQDAAAALGLVDWATAAVGSADRYRQLEGLTWLLLLDTVADDLGVRRRCRGHRDTRAAGARVLYECDHPNAVRAGTELLLDATEPLSVLGLDTLYRLHDRDPAHLVAYANANHRNWPASLTIQVLRAFGECNPVSDDVSLDWAFDLLDADSPRVRAAAVAALGEYGWRTDVGDRLQTAAPTADAAPVVRRAAYSTLGEWGNTDAVRQLAAAVVVDPDPRCRLAAARALPDGAEGDERGAIEPVETDGSFPGPADGTASLDDAPALEWVAERAEPGS
jgi:HEAT repeat protein